MRSKNTYTYLLSGILCIIVLFAVLGFYVSIQTASMITASYRQYNDRENQIPTSPSFRGTTTIAEATLEESESTARTTTTTTISSTSTTKSPRFAIVHLIDDFTPIYEAALLCSVHRAVKTHSNISQAIFSGQLDLVVLVHEEQNLTGHEHPYIRYVPFNGDPIKNALQGKGYPVWEVNTHFKLCAMNLDEYDKVVFVDLDYILRSQLATILLEATPPAMVQWGEYPQLDFNSGFHILKPSQEMFQDAVQALEKIGIYQAALEELQDASTVAGLEKKIPNDPSVWGGYRSDQEFTFAFYEILPETRAKWGPIHNLPYRYNAREETVAFTTSRFLTRTITKIRPIVMPPGIFDGAHLHLFGGFGHDGRGHRVNPIPKEDGRFGLVGVHFTTRKPWKEGRLHNKTVNGIPFFEDLVNNHSLTPHERCPEFIFHIDFWEGVMNGMMEAMQDPRFGYAWTELPIFDYVAKHKLVQRCFEPEFAALRSFKEQWEADSKKTCPDSSDCQNHHCRWRRPGQACDGTSQTSQYIPLISNV